MNHVLEVRNLCVALQRRYGQLLHVEPREPLLPAGAFDAARARQVVPEPAQLAFDVLPVNGKESM